MPNYDLIIRNGQIVDGTAGPTIQGDLAVANGKIAAIGHNLEGTAAKEIDANGLLVTPGFDDVHTH